jgi:exopolysaccharide biosynthesis polyprenyl glycosylphosphotransferase
MVCDISDAKQISVSRKNFLKNAKERAGTLPLFSQHHVVTCAAPGTSSAPGTRKPTEAHKVSEGGWKFQYTEPDMKRSEVLFGLLRIPLDALGLTAALLLSYRLREANIDLIPRVQLLEPAVTLPSFETYVQTFVLPSIIVFALLASLLGLYALQSTRSAWDETGRIIISCLLWLVAVMGWFFLVQKQLFYSRILLLHATVFMVLFVALARAAVVLLQRAFLRGGIGVRQVASLGTQPIAQSALRTLEQDIRYHYLGHCDSLSALQKIRTKGDVDLVLQTDANPVAEQTIELIEFCRAQHIGYAFLPPVFADVPHLLRVEHLGLVPMMRFQPTPLDGWGRVLKRMFDMLVSAVLFLILLPFFVLLTLCILIENGWPVFYVSRRIGEQARRHIPVLKFRSMVRGADAQKGTLAAQNERHDGPLFKLRSDPRVTRFGRFLRRWDLDELPQLLNVIVGHMSLVGPRPHLPEEVERYSSAERRVFAVRPGITGLAQVSGRSTLTFKEEVRLDLQYIEEWSLLLDLWILWRTIFVVFTRSTKG